MKFVFVISPSEDLAATLKRNLQIEFPVEVIFIEIPYVASPENIDPISLFKIIYKDLVEYSFDILRNSVAVLNLPFSSSNLNDYDLLKKDYGINQVVPLLLFSFPEVYWIFPLYSDEKTNNHFVNVCEIIDFFSRGFYKGSPLFDYTNIRNDILKKTKETHTELNYLNVEQTPPCAASIDEEEAYAYLHAYIAYRLGFRSYVVLNYKDMASLEGVDLVFEDIFLNFPDYHPPDFSSLNKRGEYFRYLNQANKRIFITVGYRSKFEMENRNYINNYRRMGKFIKKIYKPTGGIYNLLEKSGLLKEYRQKRKKEWESCKSPYKEPETQHSAPGKLLLIADSLIYRAEKIFKEAITVEDCIHGATLAFLAQTLLGYRTPTTALEAISLRHQLEVKAECMFYGMAYNIDVKNRIKEIEKEIEVVGNWFNKKIRKKMALDAKMRIINKIMDIFKEYGQFDEEEECLKYFRKLNRVWSLKQPGFTGFLSWIIYPIRWYIETLLEAFPLFVVSLFFWPFIFSIFNYLVKAKYEGEPFQSIWDNFINSLNAFFNLSFVKQPTDGWANFVTISLGILGFFHLGIFISYLYTLITRGKR